MTNTLLFGGLLGESSLKAPLADWDQLGDFSDRFAAVRAASETAPQDFATPLEEDLFSLLSPVVHEQSEGMVSGTTVIFSDGPSIQFASTTSPAFGELGDLSADASVLPDHLPAVAPSGINIPGTQGAADSPAGFSNATSSTPAAPPNAVTPFSMTPPAVPIAPTLGFGGGMAVTPGNRGPLPVPPRLIAGNGLSTYAPPPTFTRASPIFGGGRSQLGGAGSDGGGMSGSAPSSPENGSGSCGCTPHVRIQAIDEVAGMWGANGVQGTSTGAFEVRRSGDLDHDLTVYYSVATGPGNSNAVPGVDYQELSGSVTIPAGQKGAAIVVQPIQMTSAYAQKWVIASLDPSEAYITDESAATVTINQNAGDWPQPYYDTFPVPSIIFDNVDWESAELPNGSVSTGATVVWRGGYQYEWGTETNTAAVTIPYAVSGSATPGADYAPLSGTVTLPQNVFAANIPLTPVDDALLEGTENVWITPTPGPTYQIVYNTAVAVEIYDNENGETPKAVDDQYAMSVDDQSLTIPADGVLCNDISYADGALTAGPSVISTDLGGTVILNPDGGFSYTPTLALRQTGGYDGFWYTATLTTQLGQVQVQARVVVAVVKVDLQMAGVAEADEETVGGFVPVNADNDNANTNAAGQRWIAPGIPFQRDFDVNPMPILNGAQVEDQDLLAISISITPNVGLPGTFWLTSGNDGASQVRLWRNPDKMQRAEGQYQQVGLPSPVFVEGAQNGDALRESNVILSYRFLNFACQPPIDIAGDRINLTVTPVVNTFEFRPGSVQLLKIGGITWGMQATAGALNPDGTAPPNWSPTGAHLKANVNRNGLGGGPVAIQNAGVPPATPAIVNGDGGALVSGYTLRNAAGVIFRFNAVLWDAAAGVAVDAALDKAGSAQPPPPDYAFTVEAPAPGMVEVSAYDSPAHALNLAGDAVWLRDMAIRNYFRMYLVWRFDPEDDGNSAIYTIAYRDWTVYFRGDGWVAGVGINNVNAASEIRSDGWTRSHEVPGILDGKTYNNLLAVRPIA